MIDDKYEYFAFISYKEEDSEWVKWLQRMLENYKLPVALRKGYPELPEYIRPIYEYKSDAGGGRLKNVLWKGLTSSKYLIVICSPRATRSKWLNDGIRYFVEPRQEENIIPFIVEGKPKAVIREEECFPSTLLELEGERELRGININEGGRDFAAVKVVSQMFDIELNLLWNRYEKEQKIQQKRKIGIVLGTLLIIAIISVVFAYIVVSKNRDLEEVNESLRLTKDSIQKINMELITTNTNLSVVKDSIQKINIELVTTNTNLSVAKDSIQKINEELKATNMNLKEANNKVGELYDTVNESNTELLTVYSKLGDNKNVQRMQALMIVHKNMYEKENDEINLLGEKAVTNELQKIEEKVVANELQKQELIKAAKINLSSFDMKLNDLNVKLESKK